MCQINKELKICTAQETRNYHLNETKLSSKLKVVDPLILSNPFSISECRREPLKAGLLMERSLELKKMVLM